MSKKQKKMLLRIIIAAVVWVAGFVLEHVLDIDSAGRFSVPGFIHLGIFVAAYFIIGWDILWKAIRNIAHGQVFDENFLMTIASIGAMVIGEYDEGVAVMILYQVGEQFQSVAVGKSRRSIAEMVDINPEYANVERDGEVSEVSPEDVAAGEIIVVDSIKMDAIKTKDFRTFLGAVKAEGKALVVTPAKDEIIVKSARNIPGVETAMANLINVYDILKAKYLVIDKEALAVIEEVFA